MSDAAPPIDSAETREGRSLSGRTVNAAQWQMASAATRGLLQFGVTVLLARLLTPSDFGLVALALIVVGFAEMVVDLGIGPAIVQRDVLTDRHLRTSFTVSSIIGAGTALLLLGAAPFFAPLLRNEAVPELLRWQSLIFLFAGLGATARAVLGRALDFRSLFFADLFSYGIGYALVAVTLALLGFGPWALVVGSLAQALAGAAALLLRARHPMRPLLARVELHDLLNFGFGVILNRLVVYVSYNGDYFVVGRWLGPAALGLYSRAFQLMMFPLTHLRAVTWNVLFSAYSRLQGDRRRAAGAYLKGVQLTTLVVGPVMAGMVVAGPHLIVGLYGSQWRSAALPLQLLCAFGLFRSLYSMTGALTHAFGEVYAEARLQVVFAVLVIGGSIVGSRWGIVGVALAVGLSMVYMYVAMAYLGKRIAGFSWREFFTAQAPGLLVSTGVVLITVPLRLALEALGWTSGPILTALVAASGVALPLAFHMVPARFRPAVPIPAALQRAWQGFRDRIHRPLADDTAAP